MLSVLKKKWGCVHSCVQPHASNAAYYIKFEFAHPRIFLWLVNAHHYRKHTMQNQTDRVEIVWERRPMTNRRKEKRGVE